MESEPDDNAEDEITSTQQNHDEAVPNKNVQIGSNGKANNAEISGENQESEAELEELNNDQIEPQAEKKVCIFIAN